MNKYSKNIKKTILFIFATQAIIANAAVPPQTTPLPKASSPTYNELVSFDSYIVRDGSQSQNLDSNLIVKNDDYSQGNRITYLGFNVDKYNIDGFIRQVSLKLHVTSDASSDINVVLVKDDSFWNSIFNWESRPETDTVLGSFSTSERDEAGWITVPLNNEVLVEIANNGQLSLGLIGQTYRAYNQFSSFESGQELSPKLIIESDAQNIADSNDIRYLNVVAAKEENGFNGTNIAEFNVIDTDGVLISRNDWKVIKATALDGWENMFDGEHNTHWHVPEATPNYFTLDLGENIDINAVVYTPQKNGYSGRIKDLLVYGSSNGEEWRLIASRNIPHGNGNAPHVAFTGSSSDLPQVEQSQSITIKPSWDLERTRLNNSAGRSPLNVTSLYFQEEGTVSAWVSNVDEDDYLEIRDGFWDGSIRHRLTKGLNSFKVSSGSRLYFHIASQNSQDVNRVASTRIMASNALYYPVFKSSITTQKDWVDMLGEYPESLSTEVVSDKFILEFRRDFSEGDIYNNMQELIDMYDEVYRPVHLAAGIDSRDDNYLHLPDANPYNVVSRVDGYMAASINRILYDFNLISRMIKSNEVKDFWGIWHEMGHNLQTQGLTWAGQGEVSVNIYAFAARAYNTPLSELVEQYDTPFQTAYSNLKTVTAYTELASTNREMMFHHLFFLFGETFMYNLHQRYRENMHGLTNDPEFEIGATDVEQMNIMAIMASKVTQRNLVDLFDFWKFPLTQETIMTIDNYNYDNLSDFNKLPSSLVAGKREDIFDMRF